MPQMRDIFPRVPPTPPPTVCTFVAGKGKGLWIYIQVPRTTPRAGAQGH